MTTTTAPTEAELEQARELEFPEDLDWQDHCTVRVHQSDSRLKTTAGDWLYALEHQYAGVGDIVNGEAEPYVHDTIEPGIHVAYSFTPTLRDGRITVLMEMHPAVLDHHKSPHAIGDEVLMRAEVTVEFVSQRTQVLVAEAIRENHWTPKEAEASVEDLLTEDGELPEGLDWSMDFAVLVDPDDPLAVSTGWTAALCNGAGHPGPAMEGNHTAAEELHGTTTAYSFRFSVNDRGLPVAHGARHPVLGGSTDLEPDMGEELATAEIVMEPLDLRTLNAMRQYIHRHHS